MRSWIVSRNKKGLKNIQKVLVKGLRKDSVELVDEDVGRFLNCKEAVKKFRVKRVVQKLTGQTLPTTYRK